MTQTTPEPTIQRATVPADVKRYYRLAIVELLRPGGGSRGQVGPCYRRHRLVRQAFIKTVLDRYKPRRLIVFSRDELKQYEMAQELKAKGPLACAISSAMSAIASASKWRCADVDYVIHAAALKHVPAAEYNPFECIQTNVLGAENVVQAAISCGVQARSSRCRPTRPPIRSISTAPSKLASDKIFVAANHLSGRVGTRFAVVRYGNVVGSRGSVSAVLPEALSRTAPTACRSPMPAMTGSGSRLQQGVDFVLSCLDDDARRRDLRAEDSEHADRSTWPRQLAPGIPIRSSASARARSCTRS